MNFLNVTTESQDCISCVLPTNTVTKCCRASICEGCIIEWLKRKRECMHCKQDQLPFDDWVANYRDVPEVAQEMILLQGVLHYYIEPIENDSEGSNDSNENYYDDEEIINADIQNIFTQAFLNGINNDTFYTNTINANALMQLVGQIFGNNYE